MKKILLASVVIATSALVQANTCEECGVTFWPKTGQNGKLCPDCTPEGKRMRKIESRMRAQFLAEGQKSQKDNEAIQQLAPALIANLREVKDSPEKQVEMMKYLTGKWNAVDFWTIFVSEADFRAIRTFWLDPADEKVYLASKNAMNAQSESTGSEVAVTTKKAGTAFALKRDKTGKNIRFVESPGFSAQVVAAALLGGKLETVKYFESQCGGFTPEFRDAVAAATREIVCRRLEITEQFTAPLEQAKAKLAKAEDKYDEAAARKEIEACQQKLSTVPMFSVDAKCWKYFFRGTAVVPAFTADSVKEWKGEKARDAIFSKSFMFKMTQKATAIDAKMEKGDALSVIGGLMNMADEGKSAQARYDRLLDNAGAFVIEINNALLPPGYTLVGSSVQWTPRLIHKEKPQLMAGEKENEWVVAPGYRKTADDKFEWVPRTVHPFQTGLVAATKEGSWTALPGFVMVGDAKAEWKAGKTHPEHAGIVSGKTMGNWIPATGYRWKNPENETDVSVEKE